MSIVRPDTWVVVLIIVVIWARFDQVQGILESLITLSSIAIVRRAMCANVGTPLAEARS
ncbi:hypothetical protein [Streptomyces sp. NBRC 110028]|uniref:hypothetical protein n=1 Tax=Streptomyces sp. NBRC 110028 TaxID=1621260 RepID=UPI00131D5C4B|nr:hypothetical protein [Streptomyces sp. NBRC 110028]